MKTKKFDKKLTLDKKTVTELSENDMKGVNGGQETLAGPRCVTVDNCYPGNTNVVLCW